MKKRSMSFAAGLLVGAVMFGGSVAYAAGIVAERSAHPIYVDGQQIQMEVFIINDQNYVKLGDLAEHIRFDLKWDEATRAVYISTEPKNQQVEQYVPKTDDTIPCDDGSNYTVTDVSRWDTNVFASGPAGGLPAATCNWSAFPTLALPKAEARRFNDQYGDTCSCVITSRCAGCSTPSTTLWAANSPPGGTANP